MIPTWFRQSLCEVPLKSYMLMSAALLAGTVYFAYDHYNYMNNSQKNNVEQVNQTKNTADSLEDSIQSEINYQKIKEEK